jgi:hypothetical protein
MEGENSEIEPEDVTPFETAGHFLDLSEGLWYNVSVPAWG